MQGKVDSCPVNSRESTVVERVKQGISSEGRSTVNMVGL